MTLRYTKLWGSKKFLFVCVYHDVPCHVPTFKTVAPPLPLCTEGSHDAKVKAQAMLSSDLNACHTVIDMTFHSQIISELRMTRRH